MKKILFLALFTSGAIAAPIDMALYQSYDANRDGFVDRVEVEGSVDLQGRFQDIDIDTDGRISAAEMQAWLAKPDRETQLRDSAPIDRDAQRRAIERSREARRQQAALALSPQSQQGQARPSGEVPKPAATQ